MLSVSLKGPTQLRGMGEEELDEYPEQRNIFDGCRRPFGVGDLVVIGQNTLVTIANGIFNAKGIFKTGMVGIVVHVYASCMHYDVFLQDGKVIKCMHMRWFMNE